jgi:hypothetical protein
MTELTIPKDKAGVVKFLPSEGFQIPHTILRKRDSEAWNLFLDVGWFLMSTITGCDCRFWAPHKAPQGLDGRSCSTHDRFSKRGSGDGEIEDALSAAQGGGPGKILVFGPAPHVPPLRLLLLGVE